MLIGRQTLQDLLVDGAIAHPVDESLDDLEVDVGLEQRHPDLAQRRLDGRFREADLAAQGAKDALEAIAEGLKHGLEAGAAPLLPVTRRLRL